MDQNQTITIKLKPYLQEYLTCKLDGSLTVSQSNIIGVMMAPLLEYCPKDYRPENVKDKKLRFTLVLEDGIGGKRIHRGIYISEKNQKMFEKMLEMHFFDLFFSYVDDKIRYKKEIKKCILQFCMDYNLTFNDISFEMLKKRYYRRKILNKGKSVHKLSLTCPLIFLM